MLIIGNVEYIQECLSGDLVIIESFGQDLYKIRLSTMGKEDYTGHVIDVTIQKGMDI